MDDLRIKRTICKILNCVGKFITDIGTKLGLDKHKINNYETNNVGDKQQKRAKVIYISRSMRHKEAIVTKTYTSLN